MIALIDALVFKEAEHLAQLADANPGQSIGEAFDRRIGLFANGGHGDGCARALALFKTRNGNFPFPAIRPSFIGLLYDAALGCLNELKQLVNLRNVGDFRANPFNRLTRVQLCGEQ